MQRTDGKIYQVSKLNVGQSQRLNYRQHELFVREQLGLPYGVMPDQMFEVTQVVTDTGGSADEWNPNVEFAYEHSATGQFVGFNDHHYRYWGFDTSYQTWNDLTLNTPLSFAVNRVNPWAPTIDDPTNNTFEVTYKGKSVVDTLWGKREVCVTQYTGEFAFEKKAAASPDLDDVYITEVFTDYVDSNKLVHRSERQYLEYSSAQKQTPTGGFTDYVKVLSGFVSDNTLYGLDPIYGHVPDEQPNTMEQCLASLSDQTPAETLTYDITRVNDSDFITGIYYWDLEMNTDVSWQDKSLLVESGLFGELYRNGSSIAKFLELYYTDDQDIFQGMEARESGSSEVKWGSVLERRFMDTLEGSYRLPEVDTRYTRAVSPDTQYGSWDNAEYISSEVYLGKEVLSLPVNGATEQIEVCHSFRSSQGQLFENVSWLETDRQQQYDWFDAKGLVQREVTKKDGTFESWLRSGVNQPMPIYMLCESQNSGEVESSVVTYADFVRAARSCSYQAFSLDMLQNQTIVNYGADGLYRYILNSDGSGLYQEREIEEPDFDAPIQWQLNYDGVLSIVNGDDTEHFALVTTQGDQISLLAFYEWTERQGVPEEEVRYTEMIGQEYWVE